MEHMQELCVDVRNWPSALSPAHTSSTLFSVVVFLEYIVKVAYFFFSFLLQVASLFASYILGYLGAAKMQSILVTHMVQ